MKCITPMNYPKAKGDRVRTTWQKRTIEKFFSYAKHGGRKATRKVARRFLEQADRKLGKPRTERFIAGLATRNTTGVVGLSIVSKRTSKTKEQLYCQVTYPTKRGKPGKQFIPIAKHGLVEAKRLGRALRKQKEKELYGRAVSYKAGRRR